MKLLFSITVLLAITISSCSSSRYGRIPKGKKQKHVVAKKQFRKKKAYSNYELLKSKKIEVGYNTSGININQLKNVSISPNIISTQSSIVIKKTKNRNVVKSSLFKPIQPQGAHIQKIIKRIVWWSGAIMFGVGMLMAIASSLFYIVNVKAFFVISGWILMLIGSIMVLFFS